MIDVKCWKKNLKKYNFYIAFFDKRKESSFSAMDLQSSQILGSKFLKIPKNLH